MVNIYKHIPLILNTTIIFMCISPSCQGKTLPHIYSVSDLVRFKSNTRITASYSVLSNLKYTSKIDTFRYDNIELKIINKDNLNNIVFNVTKKKE